MKHDAPFRQLRRRQIERSLAAFSQARQTARPRDGWLSAIREARGVTLRELATTLNVTPQAVLKLQKSEANESISIKRLSNVAEALGCELVYAVVPKQGKLTDAVNERIRQRAADRVIAAEHSMLLEGQAAGNLAERIKQETEIHDA